MIWVFVWKSGWLKFGRRPTERSASFKKESNRLVGTERYSGTKIMCLNHTSSPERGERGRSSQQVKTEAEEVSGGLRWPQRFSAEVSSGWAEGKWEQDWSLPGGQSLRRTVRTEPTPAEWEPALYRLSILRSISKHNNNECLSVTTLNTNNKLKYL